MAKAATYSVDEVAEMLGVCRDIAYQAVRAGQIPSIRLGAKRIRVPKAAFDRLLAEGNRSGETAVA